MQPKQALMLFSFSSA